MKNKILITASILLVSCQNEPVMAFKSFDVILVIFLIILVTTKLFDWFKNTKLPKNHTEKKKCKHNFELQPFFKGYKCTKCSKKKEYNMHYIIRHQYYDIFRKANMFSCDDVDFTIKFKDIPNSDKIKLMKIIRDWSWKRYASPV